jgi:hypothetical protein
MIVPIETASVPGPTMPVAPQPQAELSMDLYERDGAYVAQVYLGRCEDPALRLEVEPAEVALLGGTGSMLMRLRFRESIDVEGVTALKGCDQLTITMPKRNARSGSSDDLRCWMR